MSSEMKRALHGITAMSTSYLESIEIRLRNRFDDGELTAAEKETWKLIREELRNRY